jgi:uncharacterized Fe-S cluster-containing MiaB family protein
MQKPVPGMSDDEAVEDIRKAIDYLGRVSNRFKTKINMHLNPTYVATGTALETAFRAGHYNPPQLEDVARAALAAQSNNISIFIGLSDEGLAVPGGSFLRPDNKWMIAPLEHFNRTQDFGTLQALSNGQQLK